MKNRNTVGPRRENHVALKRTGASKLVSLSLAMGALLTAAFCYGESAAWLATGPFGGAAEIVRVVPNQPGLVLAASSNGLFYQSLDGGASWTNRFFPAQFAGALHALEVDPRFPGAWYAGVESDNRAVAGVYKTSDGGATWKLLSGISGRDVWSLAVWPAQPDVIAAGTDEGIFLSEDAGANWKRISPESNRELRPVVSLAFHPTDRSILYAGTTHLPWRTRDGGEHWESIHTGMIDDSDVFSIAVESSSPTTVFASACSGAYRSRNGGDVWTRLPTPHGAFRTYLVALDPRHAGVIFAGTSAGLLRTTDGVVWNRVSAHRVKSIAFDPVDPQKIYFASTTGGLLISRDGGNTLSESNRGYSSRNFSAVVGSKDMMYASTIYEPGDGGIFRSSDQGRTWMRMASPATPTGTNENVVLLAAAPDDSKRIYAAGYRSLFRSVDGARTWTRLVAPPGNPRITSLLALSRGVLVAGSAAGLFRLNGAAWSESKLPTGPRAVDRLQNSGDSIVAAITREGAFQSRDAGKSWTACGQTVADAVWYGLAADSGTSLAATSRGLYRSADGCASWEPVRVGLDQGTVSAVLFHPRLAGEAFATQYGRILQTKDGGRSWLPLEDQGRNGGYPGALLVLPEAPQFLFGLFPHRGILTISVVSSKDAGQ